MKKTLLCVLFSAACTSIFGQLSLDPFYYVSTSASITEQSDGSLKIQVENSSHVTQMTEEELETIVGKGGPAIIVPDCSRFRSWLGGTHFVACGPFLRIDNESNGGMEITCGNMNQQVCAVIATN